jgi:Vacuolar sorting-associated protein 13, N-terminal
LIGFGFTSCLAASQQNDSFVEKMATTIIKNLQVDVSDIHIRFEDKFSSPSMPFACGVTLKTLRFVVRTRVSLYPSCCWFIL